MSVGRRRDAWLTALGMTLATVALPHAAGAQDNARVLVTLLESSAPPDAQVVAPVSLEAPDRLRIGSIAFRIRFPTSQLTFVSVEPSGLAAGAGAEVKAEVEKASDGSDSVLKARVSVSEGRSLGSGPLAYVAFRVSQTAAPETTITLPLEASVLTADTPPQTVANVETSAGEIAVTAAPVAACFFYMH